MNMSILKKTSSNGGVFAVITGFILVFMPILILSEYADVFRFFGGSFIVFGILCHFFSKSLKNVFISNEGITAIAQTKHKLVIQFSIPKITWPVIFLLIIIESFLTNQYLMWKMTSLGILQKPFYISINITKKNNK